MQRTPLACFFSIRAATWVFLAAALVLSWPEPCLAYIGPGAGFAFLGSGLALVITMLLAAITVLFWPLRILYQLCFLRRPEKAPRARRVVILGLDGLDASLTEKYLAEEKLPNLHKLSTEGSYGRLKTTIPSLSPVAWSSFQTGVNPGAHNIYDFLRREPGSYMPALSSAETFQAPESIMLFGKQIRLGKGLIRLLRKNQPFWKILGEYGVVSTVLRVPISYPPEPFRGASLSAMCTPDLKGSQGSYSAFYWPEPPKHHPGTIGSCSILKQLSKNTFRGRIEGPPHPGSTENTALSCQFSLELLHHGEARLGINGNKYLLRPRMFSEWIELKFRFGFRSVKGIARFCLALSEQNKVALYVTPVNIDPSHPALPISHPRSFSNYLSRSQGLFGTLGFLEDTWARNEHVLDDELFLQQTELFHEEREKMLLDTLDSVREGFCCCVFDSSDRLQHMFWRYFDENHPADCPEPNRFSGVIPKLYQDMDALVGKVQSKLTSDDVLIVLSDHGFSSFRRCFNLNSWLREQGYLFANGSEQENHRFFAGVDWSKSRAFGLGLSGLYLNKLGREAKGIVANDESLKLCKEIEEKLLQIRDPESGKAVIRRVYQTSEVYKGAYLRNAPDLILGYEPGYRVSWGSVTGGIWGPIIEDNTKAWSGDHAVDPECVPGVFFANRELLKKDLSIVDLAPSVLDMFGVGIPAYMEGKVII